MSLRKQQTIRFVAVVTGILFTALISIYYFIAYFLDENFNRRLSNRSETVINWLSQTIENQENMRLLERLLKSRKDQMPSEEILIYNLKNELVFIFNNNVFETIDSTRLEEIKIQQKSEFMVDDFNAVGMLYQTSTQSYVIIALARDEYAMIFLRQMRWMMLALILISLFVVSIIGWIYAKKTIEPIENISEELSQIFPKNTNLRLRKFDGDNEISQLSETINQLLDRVEEGIHLQQMFIANVSHELQNPLTSISSQLEVSLLNERTSDNYKHTIQSVLEDTTDLIELVQNLLNLSRSDSDITHLLVEKVRIDDIIWEVHDMVANHNAHYKVHIHFTALPEDPEHLCIVGSHSLLKIALFNLVENACKFSYDNQAYISLSASAKQKKIYIKDNGIGLSKEEIEKIFQPFYRAEKTTDVKGYGIGLSLVDRIVKIHKGKIEVTSQVNKGTVFKITIDT
ncbi:sensor histidine kinase [Emticicia fontis]